jgi:hypothetical protein
MLRTCKSPPGRGGLVLSERNDDTGRLRFGVNPCQADLTTADQTPAITFPHTFVWNFIEDFMSEPSFCGVASSKTS